MSDLPTQTARQRSALALQAVEEFEDSLRRGLDDSLSTTLPNLSSTAITFVAF